MRSEAERRHHRERVINNRLDIINNVFGSWGFGNKGVGVLDKDHLTDCSCIHCQPHKYEPKVRDNSWLDYEERATGYYPYAHE